MAQRAEALEQEAEARYRAVGYPGAIDRYEEAFRAYREAGDRLGAGRAARIVAWPHGNVHGRPGGGRRVVRPGADPPGGRRPGLGGARVGPF